MCPFILQTHFSCTPLINDLANLIMIWMMCCRMTFAILSTLQISHMWNDYPMAIRGNLPNRTSEQAYQRECRVLRVVLRTPPIIITNLNTWETLIWKFKKTICYALRSGAHFFKTWIIIIANSRGYNKILMKPA